ncbi:head completion/stabilization protein [Dasania marina]|uniref:head completion/stabilization protein n=1 Tax=Dasania marina TaxID=471499 RepID=UPI00036C9D61|nr:head completion/stabilization protein [Dasania marina]
MYTGKSDDYLATQIENDGFYPSFTLGDFQRDYKMPSEFAQETVTQHLILAMVEVNNSLSAQKAEWQGQGSATLEAVVSPTINNERVNVFYYRRAVFAKAKYLLFGQLISYSQRDTAEHYGKQSEEVRDEFLAESNSAIKALQGRRGRIYVAAL